MPILPIDWLKTSEKAVIPRKHELNAPKLHNPTSVLCSFGMKMHNPTSVLCSFGVEMHNLTSVLYSFGVKMHNPTSVQCSFGVEMHNPTSVQCSFGVKMHNPTSVLCSFGVKMHNPTSVQCSFVFLVVVTNRHMTCDTRLCRFCVMQDSCTMACYANACCNMARTKKTSTTSHGDCACSMGLRKLSTLYPTPTRWSRAVSTRCRSKRG